MEVSDLERVLVLSAMSELETTIGGSGRPETTIKLKIGQSLLCKLQLVVRLNSFDIKSVVYTLCACAVEAKKLPAPHELRHNRDCYVVVALDQEEIFRTATVEKSLR